MDVTKNFLVGSSEEEEAFLAEYRRRRSLELLEHIRFKQKPLDGALFDYAGKLVDLPKVPEQSYWRLFFEGKAPTLDNDDEAMLARVEEKHGGGKPITPLDVYNLEQAYCKLNPFMNPGEELTEKLHSFIRRVAKEEHAAGRFETLEDALSHFGMQG